MIFNMIIFNVIFVLLIVLLNVFPNIASKSSSSSQPPLLSMKRILYEWKDICKTNITLDTPFRKNDPSECGVRLSPMKNNLYEWHFSFTGIEKSPYVHGIYHGKIRLPKEYPQKAPSISIFTPSGRWEPNADICLSATAFHQETWDPNWNLRTLILSLRGFMSTQPREIGSIATDVDTQQYLALASQRYRCPHCNLDHSHLGADDRLNTLSQESRNRKYLSIFDKPFKVKNTKNSQTSKEFSHRSRSSLSTLLMQWNKYSQYVLPVVFLLIMKLWFQV